jgi:uncharacterized protein YkwD
MKRTPCLAWGGLAATMLLASCGPQLTTTTVPMSSAAVSKGDGSLAGTIHAQVNSFRSSVGRKQVSRHAGLDKMAQQHSEFMRMNRGKFGSGSAGSLTHYGFEERALKAQRMMSMSEVGENIATCSRQGSNAVPVLVNAWKNSSAHMKNMKGDWDVTGIGVSVDSDGTVFATQIFANEDHSHMTMTDRMRQF